MEEKIFFNFNGDKQFNLEEEYFALFGTNEFKPSNLGEANLKDAESIIEELGAKYMESISLQRYEQSFINLNEFLKQFRTESDEVKNMAQADRDKLFGYGKELFTYYQNSYGQLYFNFELSIKEWSFIDHTLTRKLSYNGQELFNYWELFIKFIDPTREIVKQLPKQIESFVPNCSIQSLVLLSHLLMTNEEKASTDSFHYFRTVLTEVAKMTKLFNAYGVILERIKNRFNHWVNALNAMDGLNNDYRSNDAEQQQ